MLKQAHKGWLIWDKGQRGLSMSDCELAYTSFDTPTRIFTLNRVELQIEGTIHPTQKPVKLYEWVLSLFARKGMKIIDTHAGSASSLVACQRIGGSRNKIEAARLRAQGVKSGVPDLCLPVARGANHGLYIELKRQRGGRISEEQVRWIDGLLKQGYAAAICKGWQEAASVIIDYLRQKTEG